MRKGLFWLNDKQWPQIKPHLPTNQPGPARDDD
ncbi:transposase [Bradyrhizobium sp. USDA 336]